ncbi:MAG: toll/interleukin-1 receptor domain-containing protein [Bryobacteraceae bacterium]
MATVFLAHSPPDHDFARRLAGFLELGCNLTCYIDDGQIGENQDLIAKAEEGLCADVLLLLLSPSSSPPRWIRERWEAVLFDQAKQEKVEVVTMLLRECSFPPLLRRRNFIDATTNRLTAWRLLKRWFGLRQRESGAAPSREFSGDLEDLYVTLADRAGTLQVNGAAASRFAAEAEEEFEAVLWVPCHGRTLAQASGELSHQLGLTLDLTVEENCGRIRELLTTRRCLVVLDAPGTEISQELTAGGRTSTAITHDIVKILKTPATEAYARQLVAARRFAEAYELLYHLLDAADDPESCARELTWICEHWDRVDEANLLRLNYRQAGAEQLVLF